MCWHKWTFWCSPVWREYAGARGDTGAGEWWQKRSCLKCGKAQMRQV